MNSSRTMPAGAVKSCIVALKTINGLRQEIEKSRAEELMNDRVALGNAIVAEARYECARLDYETARDHGEAFRFRIRDVSLKADRRISAFDVETARGRTGNEGRR